jgi:hypothetical protein
MMLWQDTKAGGVDGGVRTYGGVGRRGRQPGQGAGEHANATALLHFVSPPGIPWEVTRRSLPEASG